MSCQISLLKSILAILNTVLSLLGIGLIALSVYELNSSTPGTVAHIAVVVQIFVGSFVILTSFLGCFNVCRESVSLTWSYAICMFLLLAFQIYILIVAHITDSVKNAIDRFDIFWQNITFYDTEITEIQQRYKCCGRQGHVDYLHMGRQIPINCFENYEKNPEKLFTNNCLDVVKYIAVQSSKTGLTIKWTLFNVELLALAISALMGVTIRNKQRRQQFHD